MSGWNLYLDDGRTPPADGRDYVAARTPRAELDLRVRLGFPAFMSLDHDLGEQPDTMRCLRALARDHPVPPFIPEHGVHSANPVGKANIIAFIESRRKSLKQP